MGRPRAGVRARTEVEVDESHVVHANSEHTAPKACLKRSNVAHSASVTARQPEFHISPPGSAGGDHVEFVGHVPRAKFEGLADNVSTGIHIDISDYEFWLRSVGWLTSSTTRRASTMSTLSVRSIPRCRIGCIAVIDRWEIETAERNTKKIRAKVQVELSGPSLICGRTEKEPSSSASHQVSVFDGSSDAGCWFHIRIAIELPRNDIEQVGGEGVSISTLSKDDNKFTGILRTLKVRLHSHVLRQTRGHHLYIGRSWVAMVIYGIREASHSANEVDIALLGLLTLHGRPIICSNIDVFEEDIQRNSVPAPIEVVVLKPQIDQVLQGIRVLVKY